MSCNYPNTVCKDWFTRLSVKLLYCAATVGPTPALSKRALCTWLDAIVSRIAKGDPRVFGLGRTRHDGIYHQLKQAEFAIILSLLSNLNQWGGECSAPPAPVSCGTFFMTVPGGRGGITQTQIICGPFVS